LSFPEAHCLRRAGRAQLPVYSLESRRTWRRWLGGYLAGLPEKTGLKEAW